MLSFLESGAKIGKISMFVYITLALVVGVFALQENGSVTKKTRKHFYFSLLVFLLIVGLRYRHGDYGTYEMGYNEDIDVGGDAGYFQLQQWFHHIGASFQFFVFVITLFSVLAFRKIFNISCWPLFGMAVILGKIFTLYAMSGIRQYVAMALCWWALYELLANKRKIHFFVMLFLAYTLHGSALILLPVYFFRERKFTFQTAFFILLASVIIGRFSMTFFATASDMSDLVRDRFGTYVSESQASEEDMGMNLLNYFENFLFLALALFARKKAMGKIPYYDLFLYMFVIYCGFLIAGKDVGIIKRLRDYYVIAYAFIVPGYFCLFKSKRYFQLSRLVMVAYFIFLMFRSLYVFDSSFPPNTYGRMIPYHSIFQKP